MSSNTCENLREMYVEVSFALAQLDGSRVPYNIEFSLDEFQVSHFDCHLFQKYRNIYEL